MGSDDGEPPLDIEDDKVIIPGRKRVRPDKLSEDKNFDGESDDKLKRRSSQENFPKRILLEVFLPTIFALYQC
jgi:hypothetical protein